MLQQLDRPQARELRRSGSIRVILACQVLTLSVWFASTAALPSISATQHISEGRLAAMTSMIQLGFVVGTIASAILGLADRIEPRKFFASAALLASSSTCALVFVAPAGWTALSLRLLTGVALAGVYPVGMRMIASWATNDTGKLIGLLVGALTLGSASPHLVKATVSVQWKTVYLVAAVAALCAALLIRWSRLGPGYAKAPRFNPRAAALAWRSKPIRLANLGYLGHMWELYAMWAWMGTFLLATFVQADVHHAKTLAALGAFAVIAVGGAGAVVGGRMADRYGRTAVTIISMAVSGSCALLVGWTFGGSPLLVMALALVWGFSIISDSAQFSASIVELAPSDSIGTMLTVQTCAGFGLTLVTIQSVGHLVNLGGWPLGFSILAIGPFLGCVAMMRLRRDPAATRLAGGRK